MSKITFLVVAVCLVAVTSSREWSDVPDDDVSLDKRAECRDRFSNCYNYESYCKRNKWIRTKCPRTCRSCRGRPRTTPRPTNSAMRPCTKQDRSACQQWKRNGFCKLGHKYYYFMSKNCPGACGFCRLTKKPTNEKHSVSVNIQECLETHNRYRARHGAPPLKWDRKLAAQANKYALYLAGIKRMKHAETSDGENLAARRGSGNLKYTCAQATKAWYDEVKDYSYSRPGFSSATGHFTQVVWKSTKRLGVGIAKNGGFTIIVARYNPGGNINSPRYFRKNVGRKRY